MFECIMKYILRTKNIQYFANMCFNFFKFFFEIENLSRIIIEMLAPSLNLNERIVSLKAIKDNMRLEYVYRTIREKLRAT